MSKITWTRDGKTICIYNCELCLCTIDGDKDNVPMLEVKINFAKTIHICEDCFEKIEHSY